MGRGTAERRKKRTTELDAVLTLLNHGIPLFDGFKLLSYPELADKAEDFIRTYESNTLKDSLSLAESVRMAIISTQSSKGLAAYNRWSNERAKRIKDLVHKEPTTLFSKLKQGKEKKRTLFNILRGEG